MCVYKHIYHISFNKDNYEMYLNRTIDNFKRMYKNAFGSVFCFDKCIFKQQNLMGLSHRKNFTSFVVKVPDYGMKIIIVTIIVLWFRIN